MTLHEQLREKAGLGDLPEPAEVAKRWEATSGDRPHPSGDDRYAIYRVVQGGLPHAHQRLAETSREGIGLTLCTLHEEEQITGDSRVGILDRETRQWIVNPWAAGR